MKKTTSPQPKALYLLFAVRMWECFSFYGMRALLILYMIEELHFSESYAFGLYALYCALVEMGGAIGGTLADRCLGLRKSISIGGILIAAGHLCLAAGDPHHAFLWSLALIIIGSSLFAGNITALLGQFYEKEDPRREPGFTLFYMGINIGALLATLLCGTVGEAYGWDYGFGLAAIGMLLGNGAFFLFKPVLENKGLGPKVNLRKKGTLTVLYLLIGVPLSVFLLKNEDIFMAILPCFPLLAAIYIFSRIRKALSFSQTLTLGLYLSIFSIFFAAEEQIGSSLMVYSEKYGTGTLLGIPVHPSLLLCMNPAVIIAGGFILNHYSSSPSPKRLGKRIALACGIGAAAFFLLSLCCLTVSASSLVPLEILFMIFGLISLAELLLAPAVMAHCAAAAPTEFKGLTMGLISLCFSFASLLGGFFSKGMAAKEGIDNLQAYQQGYFLIGLILICLAALPILQTIFIYKEKEVRYD